MKQSTTCASCGRATAESARGDLCPRCSAVPGNCHHCGRNNPPEANFCNGCGNKLRADNHAAPARVQVPPYLTERVLRSQDALEGERRRVTVLFADLVGSTQLIENLDPEDAQQLLEAPVKAMIEGVHRYEGTVNQVMGDGIMALFGAPIAHEDHTVRAACAALAMQDAIARLDDECWRVRGLRPRIRVGFNSGEVVIHAVRTDLSVDYRAVGSTTHMAARMEANAEPGTVWLTGETMRQGGGLLRARPLGHRSVRGVQEPVEIYQLDGVSVRTRFQATVGRGLSPLVGRDEVMSILHGGLASAQAGRPAVVACSGPPGVGKSRLCYELLESPAGNKLRVLEASAPSYGRTTPHGVLVGLLKSMFEIDDTDDRERTLLKIQTGLTSLELRIGTMEPVVSALLGLHDDDRAWHDLDAVRRRRLIEEVARTLLEACCGTHPAVLLLEDLHWCDPDSLEFVKSIVRRPPARRLLILISNRGPLAEDLTELPHVTICRLSDLPREDTHVLLSALLGDHPGLTELRGRLTRRSGGNPFFIEESIRALVEAGALIGALGDYQPGKDPAHVDVPAKVEALIASRLGRLTHDDTSLLQMLAVIGGEVPVELLRRVAGLPVDALNARLASLTAADLLYETGTATSPVFRPRHALVTEVVYGAMLRKRKCTLHMQVVEAMEELYRDRLSDKVERLAEHTLRAELWLKCIDYHRLSCTRAAHRSANEQAVEYLQRGIDLLHRLPEGPDKDRASIDLRLTALAALVPLGAHARCVRVLDEAERCARRLGDARRLGAVTSQLSTALFLAGEHDKAMEVAKGTIERADADGSGGFALRQSALYNKAMVHHARGEYPEALHLLRELQGVFVGELARRRMGWAGYPSVFVRTFIISSLTIVGGMEEACRVFEEGKQIADEVKHPYSRTMILEEYGFMKYVYGEFEQARELLQEALDICIDGEVHVMRAPISARLGTAIMECGDVRKGRALVEEAFSEGTYERAGHYAYSYLLMALSVTRARDGETAGAVAAAREAEKVTRESEEHGYHVCSLVHLAWALAAAEDLTQALQCYQEAIDKAVRLGARPWLAHALRGQGALLIQLGEKDRSLQARLRAQAVWRELGAQAQLVPSPEDAP